MATKIQPASENKSSASRHSKISEEQKTPASAQFAHIGTTIQQARSDPTSLNPQQVLQLQHTIGNHGVGQLMQGTAQRSTPRSTNNTGLPDRLKSGIENLSGYSMDDVKVHYNSSKPAALNALAYAQGNQIHLGAGQEKHLPHEAWHVVQQKQGRVRPTLQMKGGVGVNDDVGLEREADVMGGRAMQMRRSAKSAFEFTIHPETLATLVANGGRVLRSRAVLDFQRRVGNGATRALIQVKSSVPKRRNITAKPTQIIQPVWKKKPDEDIWLWSPLVDGVTWFRNAEGGIWFHITDASKIRVGNREAYESYHGRVLPHADWLTLRAQPETEQAEAGPEFRGEKGREFAVIWADMRSRMINDEFYINVVRFYNDRVQANSHAYQNGDVWVDPDADERVRLAAWRMFAGAMPPEVQRASPFASFATSLSSLVNAAETPFGSVAVKGIVKGGRLNFRGQVGKEKLARSPTAYIGLFAIPRNEAITGSMIQPFIEHIRQTNPKKYADLQTHFEDEGEVTIYSPGLDITEYLIHEYENPYREGW